MHPGEPLLYRMLYLVTVHQQHFQQRVLCDHSKAHHIVTQKAKPNGHTMTAELTPALLSLSLSLPHFFHYGGMQ